jgi:hypothetical protein
MPFVVVINSRPWKAYVVVNRPRGLSTAVGKGVAVRSQGLQQRAFAVRWFSCLTVLPSLQVALI